MDRELREEFDLVRPALAPGALRRVQVADDRGRGRKVAGPLWRG
jgi:hypothetical protein